ncbi:MAG: hypothetical protein HKM86_05470 [Deltaproteobacteria bacterium]|nr:hypothetical protein [Deltaproteobacteria bacterium]
MTDEKQGSFFGKDRGGFGKYELYDGRPPRVDEDTSGAAADSMLPVVNALQGKVLAFVSSCPSGATCDEVEVGLGLRHQTASARLRELYLLGRLYQTDAKRRTRSGRKARVYWSF